MSAYLEIFNLCKRFGPETAAAIVEGFDLSLARGDFVCLLGHSGCGKSTVLSMLSGLVAPTQGGVVLDGREIEGPGPDRGVVFQAPSLLPWLTALENVLLGVRRVFPHGTRAEQHAIALHSLARVGLQASQGARPGALSQGERQRVGIARAFALRPKVLLLDEPFGMLDALTRMELQDLLLEIWGRERVTALMVTHDIDEAIFLADRIAVMSRGPRASLACELRVDLPRPRARAEVFESAEYHRLRDQLISILSEQQEEALCELAAEAASAVVELSA